MRNFIVLIIVFFSFASSVLAGTVPCDTDNFTLAQCQSNCSGTWNASNASCITGNQNPDQGTNPSGSVTLINPLKAGTSIESFLNSILDFVIRIGSIIVILMTVFVGYKFVVAQGKPDKIEEAKKMLLWTIVGALVLIGAKVISSGILATVQALGG